MYRTAEEEEPVDETGKEGQGDDRESRELLQLPREKDARSKWSRVKGHRNVRRVKG